MPAAQESKAFEPGPGLQETVIYSDQGARTQAS
jgi:hypothetical protein